jgi:hypothetical protein
VGADQEKARRRGASVVFLGETRLPAPAGKPLHLGPARLHPSPAWDRHDLLRVIGAVVLSPTPTRDASSFDVQRTNVRTDDAVEFLRRFRTKARRSLIVVWDVSVP